jgi:hypothetical protein
MVSDEEGIKLVKEYLKENKDAFLQAREKFGIGERIGLGALPYFHDYFEWGELIPIKVKNNEWLASERTFFGLSSVSTFPISMLEEYKDITIQPSGSRKLFFVSIYPRQGFCERGELEKRAIEPSTKAFCGLASHEFAEYLLNFNKESIPTKFKQKVNSIKASDDQIKDQSMADVLASLYGYKQGVLAHLNLQLSCLKTYKDYPGGLVRPPHNLIKEAEERIELVEKYSSS